MLTAIEGPRLPRSVRDWIIRTVIQDYGWEPMNGAKYNRAFGLNEIVRELLKEAATKPEFAKHAETCLKRAASKNTKDVVLSVFKNHVSRKERFVRVDSCVFARYDDQDRLKTYLVEVNRRKISKKTIRRHIPGTLADAISYRDRLLKVLDGPNPYDWENVPLIADE